MGCAVKVYSVGCGCRICSMDVHCRSEFCGSEWFDIKCTVRDVCYRLVCCGMYGVGYGKYAVGCVVWDV